MSQSTIVRVALPLPLRRCFDYLHTLAEGEVLQIGMRVKVPFQSRKMVGVIIDLPLESEVPRKKLKAISEVMDVEPALPADVFQLCLWAADYYHHPIGEVLWAALPGSLRRSKTHARKKKINEALSASEVELPLVLNQAQQEAINTILNYKNIFQVFLLDGITGSGKTEVYLQVIDNILQAGEQVLVLVPEISLTPQTLQRFRQRFNVPIVAWHSNLTDKERYEAWLLAQSGTAKIIIGTRSAVFIPLPQLGLIIIDEEHDGSFKQQERFRYHARDLAIVRSKAKKVPIVLGSATPSLETFSNALRARYIHLRLPERAGVACVPKFHLVDLRQQKAEQGISAPLLKAIGEHLQQGNQVMLFLNRRGYAPIWMCCQCNKIVDCKRCDARMVYHQSSAYLHCHHCDSRKPLPRVCDECRATEFQPVGVGTQRIEKVLQKHFPTIPIVRIDRDSTKRKGEMEKLFEEMHTDVPQILIGTQMLAKGHHLPNVTLVGVIDLDSGLLSADFRALERTGQLLLQVSGRAGRAEKPGTVFIQTQQPDHPLLLQLVQQGYSAFAQTLLAERKDAHLPPYSHFALFRAEAHDITEVECFLQEVKNILPNSEWIKLAGPMPALMTHKAGMHRMHLLIQSAQRSPVQNFLKNLLPHLEKLVSAQKVRWTLDVDPIEIFN